MRLFFGTIFAFAVAATVGLGITWMTLTRSIAFGSVTLGAWTAWPKTGTIGIDPYARAVIARSGELPVGLGDGIAFYAHADDQGRSFDGRCELDVSGITPTARYWTLSLYDNDGKLVPNSINRFGFTSQEVIRNSDGSFTIRLGPRARYGNWLPTGGIEGYVLVLRLYDTPVGVATRAGREAPMPSIMQKDCAA